MTGEGLLVTGAASGIGNAVARRALASGYVVAVLDADAARLEASWKAADVLRLTCDVRSEASIAQALDNLQTHWGRPATALVHAAGVYRIEPTAELPATEWAQVLQINATGSFLVCREFARRLLADGTGGSVVLLTSIAASRGDRHEPAAHYAASKGAVTALARQLAVEWGGAGIRVNAVAPGVIATPMLRLTDDPERLADYLRENVPLGRLGAADEVATACLFLAGDQASYISGAVLPVDGGAGVA